MKGNFKYLFCGSLFRERTEKDPSFEEKGGFTARPNSRVINTHSSKGQVVKVRQG